MQKYIDLNRRLNDTSKLKNGLMSRSSMFTLVNKFPPIFSLFAMKFSRIQSMEKVTGVQPIQEKEQQILLQMHKQLPNDPVADKLQGHAKERLQRRCFVHEAKKLNDVHLLTTCQLVFWVWMTFKSFCKITYRRWQFAPRFHTLCRELKMKTPIGFRLWQWPLKKKAKTHSYTDDLTNAIVEDSVLVFPFTTIAATKTSQRIKRKTLWQL